MVRVAVADDKLYCRDETDGSGWSIRIADIALIAEYTTSEGPPNADDYFLLLVTREDGEAFYSTVTMAADGMGVALESLEQKLGTSLSLSLASCTVRSSNVVWPRELAGKSYFEYDLVEPEGMWAQIRARFKGKEIKERMAERVLKYLGSLEAKPEQS